MRYHRTTVFYTEKFKRIYWRHRAVGFSVVYSLVSATLRWIDASVIAIDTYQFRGKPKEKHVNALL